MKWFSFLLLTASAVLPLHAQTSLPETPGSHPHIQPAVRPPESVRPSAHARLNTAERVAAVSNKPPLQELPAFTANDRDGHPVTAKTLSRSSHWLLIYRRQDCMPCDRLMTALAASEDSGLKGGQPYVIVVAGKQSEALERVRANFSTLSDATWLGDRENHAFDALKPRGVPMIYAMDGSKIAWNVPGNLGNPAMVEKMLATWVASGKSSTSSSSATSSSTTH